MRVDPLLVLVLLAAAGCASPEPQVIAGTVTDDMCPHADHAAMSMGPTDAECTRACILAHGARYALYDGSRTYILSDQDAVEPFAGQPVRVTGAVNESTMTIEVVSIAAAP